MSSTEFDHYVKKNEKAWDEVTPIHNSYRLGEADFFKKGGVMLDNTEQRYLPDLRGKEIAHLCCNCGQDTLSLANLGGKCTGFDQSGLAIASAKKLASQASIDAEFLKFNVLEIPEEYNGKFDFVYISKGVLVWIPDQPKLMETASGLLKPGGEVFIYDQHPFVHIFDFDEPGTPVPKFDYFSLEPQEYSGLDYIGKSEYKASPNYQFMVQLQNLLHGLISSGMKISGFHEFRHSIFDSMIEQCEKAGRHIDRGQEHDYVANIPMMFLIQAVKEH